MPRSDITTEQRAEAKRLYEEDLKPVKFIAKFLNCSNPTATKVLIEEGVKIRSRGRISNSKKEVTKATKVREETKVTEPQLSKAIQEARARILKEYSQNKEGGFISNV